MSLNDEQLLDCALEIGEQMLRSGAEVWRVEDSIERIGMAYGAQRVSVFTITSSIVVSMRKNGRTLTQTRRIRSLGCDLPHLSRLNALSRRMCAEKPDEPAVRAAIAEAQRPPLPLWQQYAAYALVAGAFCVFFGGGAGDAVVSALIGALLKWLTGVSERLRMNGIVSSALFSFLGGLGAMLAVRAGLGADYSRIVIGDIMLLIPGVVLTTALRDMFSGDWFSGMQRMCQALLSSAAIATGFALAQGGLL